tara:strand:+ start:1298 stop:1939 length:642 start_codon:yes stop_codon:yes gene_type:complete
MEKVNELLQIFPTPVHISKYEKDITEELKFVKNLEYQLNGGNTGPNGNYKSDNTYVLKEKELKDISIFIQSQLDFYVKEIMCSDDKLIPTISWCNKNPQGSKHHDHKHPNSIISGVFYFAINKSAPIQFAKTTFGGLELNAKKYNNFNSGSYLVPMNVGELVLFPSITAHSVPVNQDPEERISLSFNTFSITALGSTDNLTYLSLEDLKNESK